MMKKSQYYFGWREMIIMVVLALASASVSILLPVKSHVDYGHLNKDLFYGGLIFVFWISLGAQITGKKYTAIVLTIFVAGFYLFVNPHAKGVLSLMFKDYMLFPHAWDVHKYISIMVLGLIIELTFRRSLWLAILGGGLANFALVAIRWLGIGIHANLWVLPAVLPLLIIAAIASGSAGVALAYGIRQFVSRIVSPGLRRTKLLFARRQ
jgi:hypothetical protein